MREKFFLLVCKGNLRFVLLWVRITSCLPLSFLSPFLLNATSQSVICFVGVDSGGCLHMCVQVSHN